MNAQAQNTEFKIGDHVTVINGFGLHLKGKKITDIKLDENGKQEFYIDWDCYWFPVAADRLYHENPCLITEIGGIKVAEKLLAKYEDYDRVGVSYDKDENKIVAIHQLREQVAEFKQAQAA